jgi:predicted DCC family thiol-disulfide oxidoreductase YuxK
MATPTTNRAIILYDGLCPFCLKNVSLLKRLDWLGRLRFHDCRDTAGIPANTAHLDPARMIQEMHVLTPDRATAYSGFRAVRWIAGRMPILWPLYPLLFIPGMPRLGQRLYLWIARNRFQLLPCRDGVCTIPPKQQ